MLQHALEIGTRWNAKFARCSRRQAIRLINLTVQTGLYSKSQFFTLDSKLPQCPTRLLP